MKDNANFIRTEKANSKTPGYRAARAAVGTTWVLSITMLMASPGYAPAADIYGDATDTHYFKIIAPGEVEEVQSPASSDEYDIAWGYKPENLRSDTLHVGASDTDITTHWYKAENLCIDIWGSCTGNVTGDFIQNTFNGWGGIIYVGGSVTSIGGTGERTSLFLGNSTNYGVICNIGRIGSIEYNDDETIREVKGGIQHAAFIGNYNASLGDGGAAIRNYNDPNTPAEISQISDSLFTANKAANNGGAIFNGYSIVGIIDDNVFTKNESAKNGGAIFNGENGKIHQITNSTFLNNVAATDDQNWGFGGGAIANEGEIGRITADTISGNWADSASLGGGAILNRVKAKIGEIKIKTLANNTVGRADDRSTSGGGGIANYGIIGDITIQEASGNKTWRHNGGVILNATVYFGYTEESHIGKISGERFSENFAFGSGGAIHNEGVGSVIGSIEVGLFENNIATSSGGAIRNYKGAVIESGKLDSIFKGNYALNRGGALFFEGNLSEGILGTFTGNEAHNDGGAIVISEQADMKGTHTESTSTIGKISATFTNNRTGVSRIPEGWVIGQVSDKWKSKADWIEDTQNNPLISNGGAILNGFRYVDVNVNQETGEQQKLTEWLAERQSDGTLQDAGSELYVFTSHGSTIESIEESKFHGNTAGYSTKDTPNQPENENYLASGGAIANGYIDHYISPDNVENDIYDFWLIARGNIGTISESEFKKNKALYRGGAIYNARGSIGTIKETSFTGNMAYRKSGSGYGGAIFNNMSATIDSIESSTFTQNEAGNSGGAIFNDKRGGSGGEIYNELTEESGFIGTISGSKFEENKSNTGGSAIHNLGRIGSLPGAASGESEYDATITDGIVNSSFQKNTTTQGGLENAAIYTATTLAITSKDAYKMVFTDNNVGNKGVTRDLYVAKRENGTSPDIYMIADGSGSSITTNGEILGEQGFILRLRGHADQAAELQHERSGAITFNGLVINANVLMDDVTLRLGNRKATDFGRYSTKDKPYMDVYDDTIPHNDDGLQLIPTEHPSGDGVDYDGFKGEVDSAVNNTPRQYSDVLRMSRLETRSGQVHTADNEIVNYNIGAISSNGRMSYEIGEGYYKGGRGDHYSIWSIDINLNTLKADTFTTWYKEGDPQAQSRGYMTLSGCNVIFTYDSAVDFDGYERHEPHDRDGEHSQAASSIVPEEKYPHIKDYYDVNIQVINLIKLDAKGKEMATPKSWTAANPGNINESAPLQLDLGKLSTKPVENSYMSTDYLLCEGIGYGTTKTWHDSIRIWGWRDNLAAWAEWAKSGDPQAAGKEYGKEFEVIGTHTLTRNIKRYDNANMGATNLLLQEKELMIYGNSPTNSTLNVNGYNLLAEVAAGQTLELRNLTVREVGTGDKRTGEESIYNKTQNDGTYILDNLVVDKNYTVVNDSVAIKRADWGIYNIFTSHQRSEVDLQTQAWQKSENGTAGPDAIHNELRLQRGKTYITGTIEYNNVHNDAGAETYLVVHDTADYRSENDSSFAAPSSATGAFKRFYCNSLLMNEGNFYLHNLNMQELKLRDLNIKNGNIHINTTTVDLEKEDMGRVWAYHKAWYDGSGHIIVKGMDALVVKPKDGISDAAHYIERDGRRGYETPVRFANAGVAASVVPFGEENDYADETHTRSKTYKHAKEGELYWYEVDYCYESTGDFKAGYYYYRRWLNEATGRSEFVPGVLVGPVAEAAGAMGSLQQLTDHSFEHADLFADSVYDSQQQSRYERSYTAVTPTKGKDFADTTPAAAATAHSCSGRAGFKGGLWVRPYAAYEKLPLSNGPKVTNNLYGALVGGDTSLHEYRNGWASVFSLHAAYMGSTQRYSNYGSNVRINQNGGGAGATFTLYIRNFYTALTGTVATSAGHANTTAGTENFHTLLGGVSSRSGYNISFGKGRFLLQPTLQLSYMMTTTADYTNAAGTRITSAPAHLLQLHPYVKLIMGTASCWSPSITLGYVHNLGGKTSFRANGESLPAMGTDPYVEYSLGIQRTWADKYTIFGQATGRHGGRNGVEFSAGFRCAW